MSNTTSHELSTLVWASAASEYDRLLSAIQNNAACTDHGRQGGCDVDMNQEVCAAHSLLDTQSSLDHLLTIRLNRAFYITAEWAHGPE